MPTPARPCHRSTRGNAAPEAPFEPQAAKALGLTARRQEPVDLVGSLVMTATLAEIGRIAQGVAPGVVISGRHKSPRSARDKAVRLQVQPSLVLDRIGVRVLVSSIQQCYRIVEKIHLRFPHLAREYDDYIRRPKSNGYQSIHTIILNGNGHPVEVQLRTHDMHISAEQGSASHRLYKQNQEPEPSNIRTIISSR